MLNKKVIIPNFFTSSNLVLGFIAVIIAGNKTYHSIAIAGILVFIASIFDSLDGATARALNVQSLIGEQLDSLADAVAYGIAPGAIAYWSFLYKLPDIGFGLSWGILIAPILPLCTTFRLARFNVEDSQSGFTGLPSPAAGIFISILPVVATTSPLAFSHVKYLGKMGFNLNPWSFVVIYLIVSFLMVSTIDYNKLFADIFKKGRVAIIVTAILLLFLLIFFRIWAIFIVSGLYIAIGIILYFVKKIKNRVQK